MSHYRAEMLGFNRTSQQFWQEREVGRHDDTKALESVTQISGSHINVWWFSDDFLEILFLLSSSSRYVSTWVEWGENAAVTETRPAASTWRLSSPSAWRQLAFTRGGRAACSPLSLQLRRCPAVAAESPLARHHQSSGSRRRSSGPGAAGEGCCRTASGPDPRWRPSRRKQEVWRRGSLWTASDWRDGTREEESQRFQFKHAELMSDATW